MVRKFDPKPEPSTAADTDHGAALHPHRMAGDGKHAAFPKTREVTGDATDDRAHDGSVCSDHSFTAENAALPTADEFRKRDR